MPQVSVRMAVENDLDPIAAIARANGQEEEWSATNPAYITHLMLHGRLVVAEIGGHVSGFGAAQRIGPGGVSMLCDLFVDPAMHGAGAGRAMLGELWRDAPSRMTFASHHPHAIPLYTSFGLDPWWPLFYLHGEPAAIAPLDGWQVAPVTAGQAGELELAWTGIDRTRDHHAWSVRPNGAAVAASRDGQVVAAGTVAGSAGEFGIVHLATSPASTDDAAAEAVLAVLAGTEPPGPIAHVCLPGPHPAVRPLLAAGWRVEYLDQFMATEPGLLDPRRAVPSPGQA